MAARRSRVPLTKFGRFLPWIIGLVAVFAVYQLGMAVAFFAARNWPFAGLYAVMGIAGGALGASLWVNRDTLRGKRPPE